MFSTCDYLQLTEQCDQKAEQIKPTAEEPSFQFHMQFIVQYFPNRQMGVPLI